MQNGEWWIDDSGTTVYADDDVGDTNHEAEAFWSILGVSPDGNPDLPEDLIPGDPISKATQKWLKENGTSKEVIDFFKGGADARDYALDKLNWMRVKGKNVEVHTFDDDALERLKDADLWNEEDGESDEELYIEEFSTRNTWSVPFSKLLGASIAAEVKLGRGGFGAIDALTPAQIKSLLALARLGGSVVGAKKLPGGSPPLCGLSRKSLVTYVQETNTWTLTPAGWEAAKAAEPLGGVGRAASWMRTPGGRR